MANYGKLELIFTLFLITNFPFLTHIKKYFFILRNYISSLSVFRLNVSNAYVILSETKCTWGPHKITFLWGIRKNLKPSVLIK